MRRTMVLVALTLACVLVPSVAQADELDDLQAEVIQTGSDYAAVAATVSEIEAEISELEEQIGSLKDDRCDIQSQISTYTRALYKLEQGSGLLGILLESEDLSSFIATVQYLNGLVEDREQALDDVDALTEELEGLQETLEAELEVAETAMEEAAVEMDAAIAAREELYAAQLAQEEEELSQLTLDAAQTSLASDVASEIEAADEAVEEAEEAAEEEAAANAAGSASGTVSTTTASGLSAIDWSVTKEEFVSTWGTRIDAYLSGSPLAGYGTTFAEAAWAYGVDPRLSPAISCVESTKGTYCFRSYNAWGWGSVSWSSWTEAIWAHVAGLASGYGGTLTYAGAAKYCPSNVDHWYYTVLAQMQSI